MSGLVHHSSPSQAASQNPVNLTLAIWRSNGNIVGQYSPPGSILLNGNSTITINLVNHVTSKAKITGCACTGKTNSFDPLKIQSLSGDSITLITNLLPGLSMDFGVFVEVDGQTLYFDPQATNDPR